jgi:hypothetical protein
MRGSSSFTKGCVLFKSIHITICSASFVSLSPSSLSSFTTARRFSHYQKKMAPRDPNTLANYGEWLTKHTTVDFKINFEKQRLEGSVLLELESLTDKKSQEIILGM